MPASCARRVFSVAREKSSPIVAIAAIPPRTTAAIARFDHDRRTNSGGPADEAVSGCGLYAVSGCGNFSTIASRGKPRKSNVSPQREQSKRWPSSIAPPGSVTYALQYGQETSSEAMRFLRVHISPRAPARAVARQRLQKLAAKRIATSSILARIAGPAVVSNYETGPLVHIDPPCHALID